jgi:hypothetical protein
MLLGKWREIQSEMAGVFFIGKWGEICESWKMRQITVGRLVEGKRQE